MAGVEAILFTLHLSPGDTLVATGMIESLARQYPGRFRIGFEGTAAGPIFENNPHVAKLDRATARVLQLHYPAIHETHTRPTHFLEGFCLYVEEQLGIRLPCIVARPCLYLTDAEKGWVNAIQEVAGRRIKYAVVNAGRKSDFITKHWGSSHYQAVVDHFRGRLQFVQVGEANPDHFHPPLDGVIDFRGKTDHRQLFRLIHHAEFVLGPESYTHHIAAALEKPAVTVASGFLAAHWISYPTCRLVHVQGALPCCRNNGCGKGKVTKEQAQGGDQCELPDLTGPEPLPRCMALIRPQRVIDAIEDFYHGGLLSY